VKIYTRTGDDGSTGLLGPGRVSKASPRVEAYGSVDELNAVLGVARALDTQGWIGAELGTIQAQLFTVGAELASTTPQALAALSRIEDPDIERLETWIDRLEADLPPLTSFVLPAGTALASQLHVARTVCRRAERRVVTLRESSEVEPRLVRYLNRLADLLFVMARSCNARAQVGDVPWTGRGGGAG
jgi:cob(I)alamin adenosyltransferase